MEPPIGCRKPEVTHVLVSKSSAPSVHGSRPCHLAKVMAALWVVVLGMAVPVAEAHDVPIDVTVQMFVRPEGETLRVLIRAPLEAMQEVRLPTYGQGILHLGAARSRGVLGDAAILWLAENIELYEQGEALPQLEVKAVRVSLPSDRSFASYDTALAHVLGELLPADTEIAWRQAMLDVLLETPIRSDQSELSIRPNLVRLGMEVATALRFLPPEGGERAYQLRGDPGLVPLDPRWHQAAKRFVELGFFHILDGLDHLLFLACLVIPLRRLRQLVVVVTSFTVAHSLTLIAAAYGLAPDALWFPPLVELLIAVSIVYMAFENILGPKLERRWILTFAFGLVHGFGFSFVLQESLQFAGSHLVTSLLAFNVGVELGQLFMLVLAVPLLDFLFRKVVAERMGTILMSALVAHTGWHWMTERGAVVGEYGIALPWVDALPASVLPWMAPLVIVIVLACRWARRRTVVRPRADPAAG